MARKRDPGGGEPPSKGSVIGKIGGGFEETRELMTRLLGVLQRDHGLLTGEQSRVAGLQAELKERYRRADASLSAGKQDTEAAQRALTGQQQAAAEFLQGQQAALQTQTSELGQDLQALRQSAEQSRELLTAGPRQAGQGVDDLTQAYQALNQTLEESTRAGQELLAACAQGMEQAGEELQQWVRADLENSEVLRGSAVQLIGLVEESMTARILPGLGAMASSLSQEIPASYGALTDGLAQSGEQSMLGYVKAHLNDINAMFEVTRVRAGELRQTAGAGVQQLAAEEARLRQEMEQRQRLIQQGAEVLARAHSGAGRCESTLGGVSSLAGGLLGFLGL